MIKSGRRRRPVCIDGTGAAFLMTGGTTFDSTRFPETGRCPSLGAASASAFSDDKERGR